MTVVHVFGLSLVRESDSESESESARFGSVAVHLFVDALGRGGGLC